MSDTVSSASAAASIPVVAPGATIGILGGGQLGRMIALAAARLGYRCHIFTPEQESPASLVSARTTVAAYDDRQALAAFAGAVDVVTLEFENIPLETLDFLSQRVAVRPGRLALETGQHRVREKRFFSDFARTAPWRAVHSRQELEQAVQEIGTPAILKTCRFGYDGKGQARIEADSDPGAVWDSIGAPEDAILEGFVAFDREVSVIVARSALGEVAVYDLAENVHRNHILDTSTAPANVSPALRDAAQAIAGEAVRRLELVGLLAVEMFAVGDEVLVNEMAPRPHNSGHWTMDGCVTDQFEQLVRAVCALPLGDPQARCQIVMKNLLGDDVQQWQNILSDPAARLHLYGKHEARAGRKMGHVNLIR